MFVYKEYNRQRAVEYAKKWALSRNPLFFDFARRGGDCTNFVSQCIYAGCCTMNFTPDFGWYFISPGNRAPAWTDVEYLYDFLTGTPLFITENKGIGPYGFVVDSTKAIEGDVVQLANESGDFYHSLIICGFRGGETLVCAHTNDANERPLSSYEFASLRYIHIEAVRINIPDDTCFENLFNGTSLGI